MVELYSDVSTEPAGTEMERQLRLLMETECDGRSCDDCRERFRQVGLRPTRQRVLLGQLLFSNRLLV